MTEPYWTVSVYAAATNTIWLRGFGFKPTWDNVLHALYLEWGKSDGDSNLNATLRGFITVANLVPAEFFKGSPGKYTVEVAHTPVGYVLTEKEEMYVR